MEKTNYPFYSQELDRSQVNQDSEYGEVIALLNHPKTLEQVRAGNLTLAMIRPHVGPEANLLGLSDSGCVQLIEERIQGLGVAAKFSLQFDQETIDAFYSGDPQSVMLIAEPEDPYRFDSRWPEFKEFMASGPTTILLLHSPNGDAVDLWRACLGHWNIERFRDPSTIRGSLGVNVFNNLVHGSDVSASVERELNIITKLLRRIH